MHSKSLWPQAQTEDSNSPEVGVIMGGCPLHLKVQQLLLLRIEIFSVD